MTIPTAAFSIASAVMVLAGHDYRSFGYVPDQNKPNECDEIDVGPDTPWDESLTRWWTRDLELFGGVHGFKGPFDQGRNGTSA